MEALDYILENQRIACITVKSRRMLEQLINEHFDNPPLKFEEIKIGMWVWDNMEEEWIRIKDYLGGNIFEKEVVLNDCWISFNFESNRYYRKQVK